MSLDSANLIPIESIDSPLSMLYKWESEIPDTHYMTQPVGDSVRTYTWKETAREARKVAAALLAKNYPKGSRIAILSKNCAHWMIVDLGIMMAGHVSVPIFATAGKSTISYVLEHAECPLIFVGKLDNMEAQDEAVPDSIVKVGFPYPGIELETTWESFIDVEPLADSPVPDMNEIMTIIYTSGSTGQPKGVVHTFSSLCWAARNSLSALSVNGEDRVVSYLPLAHITERVFIEFASYYSTVQIYFVESLETFKRDVIECQPTLFISVPRLWTKFQLGVLAKIPQKKLSFLLNIPFVGKKIAKKIRIQLGLDSARLWGSGSAPLAPAVIEWFSTIGIEISEAWGMTENSAYGTNSIPFKADKIGSIGKVYDGVELRISDDGEIQVRSPCNMVGYYKEPEKTAEVFTNDGYLRTGDKGVIDADGYVKITGRLKDIFKTEKGKYVAPAPIEAKLMENSIIEQVCVTGTNLPQPIALLVLSQDAQAHNKEIIEESLTTTLKSINAELESHQRLDRIVVLMQEWSIENDLLTPTLKVKRHVIEDKFKNIILGEHKTLIVWND